MPLTRSRPSAGAGALFTPVLLTCVGITAALHVATYAVNVVLPLRVVELGGSTTQVGLLFSVTAMTSMLLRPMVGGWIDRLGIRPLLVPGALALVVTLLALLFAPTPLAAIALMGGIGLSSGLISTPASVLAAQATPAGRRGEAISMYYVASSVGMALGAPAGLALLRLGGVSLTLAVACLLAVVLVVLALSPATRWEPEPSAAPARFRLYSRHAVNVAGPLILVSLGASSLYAFLPLHAIRHGLGHHLTWFFAFYSTWLVVCRLLLGRLSDRIGRATVAAPAMGATALGFFVLALPPSPVSLALAALLLGSGASLLYPTLIALVVDQTPEGERGLAIGTVSGSYDVGIVVGSSLIGALVQRTSYAAGFAAAGLAALLGLVAFLALARRAAVSPRAPAGV